MGPAAGVLRFGVIGGLDLALIAPPIKLPRIEITQYWHERFHRKPGYVWIRKVFAKLFRGRTTSPRSGPADV